VVEGLGKRGTRLANGEGDDIHSSPVSSVARDEGGVFFGIFLDLNVAAEVHAKADRHDDEGALFPFERG
jgi:hypothetical protein